MPLKLQEPPKKAFLIGFSGVKQLVSWTLSLLDRKIRDLLHFHVPDRMPECRAIAVWAE